MRLTLDMVEWSIEATPEELDPEGCFDDPRDVKMARKALHDGDVWGWCAVKVTGGAGRKRRKDNRRVSEARRQNGISERGIG